MPYQFKRESPTQEKANHLANACQTHEEKLVVWTLLDRLTTTEIYLNLSPEDVIREFQAKW